MAEDSLQNGDVFAVLQKMGSKGVAQSMGGGALVDPCLFKGLFEDALQKIGCDMGKEPLAAGYVRPVMTQQEFPDMLGQRHGAILPPLAAAHPELLPVAVDVGERELHPFGIAQAAGVDDGERHFCHGTLHLLQDRPDFFTGKHHRQLLGGARTHHGEDEPLPPQGLLIKELDAAQVNGDSAFGSLAHRDEIQKKAADIFFGQQVGGAHVMLRQVPHGIDVTLLCLVSIPG